MSLALPEAAALEAGALQRQRGRLRISVFDEFLQQPNTNKNSFNNPWVSAEPSETAVPKVLLGYLDLPWASVISSATKAAADGVESAVALKHLSTHKNDEQQQQQQKLFNEVFDVSADGTCCLCLLNGCFQLQQPKGLLTHIHLSRPHSPDVPTGLLLQLCQQQQLQQQVLLQHCTATPFDLFVSLKLEIRGPARAICCSFPRTLMPEEIYQQLQQEKRKEEQQQQQQKQPQQQQQQQRDERGPHLCQQQQPPLQQPQREPQHHAHLQQVQQERQQQQQPPLLHLQPGKDLWEDRNLIELDKKWRQKAGRKGVSGSPSSIGKCLSPNLLSFVFVCSFSSLLSSFISLYLLCFTCRGVLASLFRRVCRLCLCLLAHLPSFILRVCLFPSSTFSLALTVAIVFRICLR